MFPEPPEGFLLSRPHHRLVRAVLGFYVNGIVQRILLCSLPWLIIASVQFIYSVVTEVFPPMHYSIVYIACGWFILLLMNYWVVSSFGLLL